MQSEPLKSIHITNYYHKNSGGISTAYNRMLEAANRHRRYVRLIVPGERAAVDEIGEYGRIYYVKAAFSPVFDKRYRVMLPWNTYIFDQSPIKKILREEKPDIVEIGEKYSLSLMAGLLRKRIMNIGQKRPMLVHFSCERMDDNVEAFISKGKLVKALARLFMGNWIFPMFDFHLANSNFTAEELFEAAEPSKTSRLYNRFMNLSRRLFRSPKIPLRERILVNQCGVDNETFSASRRSSELRDNLLRRYGLSDGVRLLLYAGRISPEKNVGLLPELMKILTADTRYRFHLLVAGAGPKAAWLADEFNNQAKGRATIIGHLTDKYELADLFANCDAFVHPNPREPFGITPLEAMASGLPVVAPNSGGLLSYANEDNAWLTEPQGQAFAAAVRLVFDDEDRQREKIARGLETARAYAWKSSTDSLFKLYDKMYSEFSVRRDLYDYDKNPREFDFAEQAC